MLKYLFELNGNEIKDVAIGVNIVDKFEEPLDEGHLLLPISTRGYEYDMRGVFSIVIEDDDEVQEKYDFLIIKDNVIATSKFGYYSHQLMVVEYSHKMDNYLVHTLTKTKGIIDDTPARFQYTPDTNSNSTFVFNEDDVSGSLYIKGFVSELDVRSTYFSGQSIIFPQVPQAYVHTGSWSVGGWNDYVRKNVFIRTNMTGTSQVILNSTATNWTAVKGSWTIEYGYYDEFDIERVLYTFYIQVVDKVSITILDIINDLRDSVSKFGGIESKYYFESTRIFNVDETLASKLALIEAPQIFIQKATLRQVINAVFLFINSISRLQYVAEDEDILTADAFNIYNGVFEKQDIANFATSQDVTQLGSKGLVWGERLLPNNLDEPTMETPAEKLHNYVRSESVQITEDNFAFILERQLYQPKKFIVVIPRIEIYANRVDPISGLRRSIYLVNLELDLTSRLIDKDMWVLKLITNDFPDPVLLEPFSINVGMRNNRVENLMWEQGSYALKLSEVIGYVFQTTLIKNVIKQAIVEKLSRMELPVFISGDKISNIINFEVYDFEDNRNFFTGQYWRKWKFNFEYITFDDITFSTEREDISYNKFYSETRQNQSDKLSNISLLSRKVYGDIQRAGVPTQTFSKYHEKLGTIYPRGAVDSDGNVIVTKKLNLHNNYLLTTYMTTKDHNRLSEFIGIDQLYRWSEIPTSKQIFQRQEAYKDYLYFCPPDEVSTDEVTKINRDTAVYLIVGVLKNNVGLSPYEDKKTKITHAYVRTDGFLENYPDADFTMYAITTPVSSFGVKGGFVFSFGWESNQVANDRIKFVRSSLLVGTYWKEPIRYTDNSGRFNELWFQLSTRFTIDNDDWDAEGLLLFDGREYNLPLVRTIGDTDYETGFGDEVDRVIDCGVPLLDNATYDPLIIRKDSSQSIKINYEIGMMSKNYQEYIFGHRFFTENFIAKNVVSNPKYLYTYNTDSIKYGKFDDMLIKEGWQFKVLITLSNVSFDGSVFQFTSTLGDTFDLGLVKLWAIGDNEGKLYLACNSSNNGFKVCRKHFRPDLYEIGTIVPEVPLLNYNYVYSDMIYADMEANIEKNPAYLMEKDYSLESSMATEVFENPHFEEESMEFGLVVNMDTDFAPSFAHFQIYETLANMNVVTDYIAFGSDSTYVVEADINSSVEKNPNFDFGYQDTIVANMEFAYSPSYGTFLNEIINANMNTEVYTNVYNTSQAHVINALFNENVIGTATPTVGSPTCTTIGGENNISVSVTNNDTNTVEIRDESNTLWFTLTAGQTQTYAFDSDVVIPYRVNFTITAQATNRPVSQSVRVNQKVTTCNIA